MDSIPNKRIKLDELGEDKNEDNTILFYHAVKEGKEEAVRFLIKRGVNINFRSNKGLTPLDLALDANNFTLIKLLLDYGAVTYLQGLLGWTPLHVAAYKNNVELGNFLIKHGADLNSPGSINGNAPLHIAVEARNANFVQLLLECGADVNVKNFKKETALCMIKYVRLGNWDVIQLLLKYGIDINSKSIVGNTALHIAINKYACPIVNELLKANINVNIKNGNGDTPLLIAIKMGLDDIAICLIKNGCDINLKNNVGKSPLCVAMENNIMKLVKFFLEETNINVNEKFPELNYWTPLHFAVSLKHWRFAKMLLHKKANIHAKDECGKTPLHLAVQYQSIILVKLLVQAGCKVNVRTNEGDTPLHLIVGRSMKGSMQIKIVKFLLSQVCYINARNSKGETPLHKAVLIGDINLIKTFHALGACIDIRCNKFLSPIHTAFLKQHRSIFTLLLLPEYKPDIQECLLILKLAAQKKDIWIVNKLLSARFIAEKVTIPDKKQIVKVLSFKKSNVLHEAIQHHLREIVIICAEYGCHINEKDYLGYTPLEWALNCKSVDFLKILIENGSNVNFATRDGKPFLLSAIEKGNNTICEILVEHSADVNVRDQNQNTAMHYAALHRCSENLQTLFVHGYDVHAKNRKGHTPLETALVQSQYFSRTLVKYEAIVNAKDRINYNNSLLINYSNNLNNFYKNCEKEIAVAKNSIVNGNNLKIWDIITKGVNYLAMNVKNDVVSEFYNSRKYVDKFPKYADLIKYKFDKAVERRNAIDEVYHDFCRVFQLADLVVDKIFGYLKISDLRQLAKVLK